MRNAAIEKRVAARKALVEIAYDAGRGKTVARLRRLVCQVAPEQAKLVGARELDAIAALAVGALGQTVRGRA